MTRGNKHILEEMMEKIDIGQTLTMEIDGSRIECSYQGIGSDRLGKKYATFENKEKRWDVYEFTNSLPIGAFSVLHPSQSLFYNKTRQIEACGSSSGAAGSSGSGC